MGASATPSGTRSPDGGGENDVRGNRSALPQIAQDVRRRTPSRSRLLWFRLSAGDLSMTSRLAPVLRSARTRRSTSMRRVGFRAARFRVSSSTFRRSSTMTWRRCWRVCNRPCRATRIVPSWSGSRAESPSPTIFAGPACARARDTSGPGRLPLRNETHSVSHGTTFQSSGSSPEGVRNASGVTWGMFAWVLRLRAKMPSCHPGLRLYCLC